MNQPPEYCPYCGTEVAAVETPLHSVVETPMVYRCEPCDDYVFYNPTPGGSAAVVDGDRLLLVEDFRSPGEWKLPSGRMALGESPREGVARELEEETGLSVEPADLTYFYDEAGEPVEEQYMVGIDYAVPRAKTTGTLEAGSDATDARFFTPEGFAASEHSMKHTHVDRFGTDSLDWLLSEARRALEAGSDATDARFFTPEEFAASEHSIKYTHVDRFGTDSLDWLLQKARRALDADYRE